jgi:hypothetical protein
MKPLVSLLFVSLIILAHASDPGASAFNAQSPPQWDTLYYKNELSLDLGLPIGFLLNSATGSGVVALSYQRALTKHDFLRVSTRFSFQITSSTSGNISDSLFTLPYLASPATFLIADSVLTQSSKTYRYYSPDIRLGYEHRFGKRRVQGILGLDVLFGTEIEYTDYQYRYFKVEQVGLSSGNTGIAVTEIMRNPANACSKNINLKEGLAPMVGMFAHISKRFSMRACLMYDLFWTQSVSFASIPPAPAPSGSGFSLYTRSIIADLSLTVHF